MTLKLEAFIFFLMGFDGAMVIHYWMICDYKILDYCGISKGLVN
jgi:hypothetical protein